MTLAGAITIASDGGCSPNPGRGGWAYAFFREDPQPSTAVMGFDGEPLAGAGHAEHSTNNIMELTGLIRALQALRAEIAGGSREAIAVTLRLDSQYTLNSFFDWIPGWKRRGWTKAGGDPVKNVELMKELDALKTELEGLGVTFVKLWVKGHSGDYANELVDEMLNQARGAGYAAA